MSPLSFSLTRRPNGAPEDAASSMAPPAHDAETEAMIQIDGVGKTFTLHAQGGVRIPVLREAALTVRAGRCVALGGASGSGKSTLMRMIYGNYRIESGAVRLRHQGEWVDLAQAEPHRILEIRRLTLGYVSQFLRAIPRVPTVSVVAEPLIEAGAPREAAEERARELLGPAADSRAVVDLVAAHLLRRRAAAGEHRPRLRPSLSLPAARRAHRLPRSHQSGDGAGDDGGGQGPRRGHRRHIPRRPGA